MHRISVWVSNNPAKGAVLGVAMGLLFLLIMGAALATFTVATVESGVLEPLGVMPTVSVPVAPTVKEARELREATLGAFVEGIDADLKQLASTVNVSGFAEEMVNWKSKITLITDNANYRATARNRFVELVFDPAILRQFIMAHLNNFHQKQSEIDDLVFVELKLDVDFDSSKIELPAIDLQSFDIRMNDVVNHAQDAAWQSIGEFAVSSGVGYFTGGAAAQALSAYGAKDDYGNPTLGNQVASFVGGFLVDVATDQFVSTLADTQGRLESSLMSTIDASFQVLYSGGSGDECWKAPLRHILEHHDRECKRIITEKMGYAF